MSSKIILMNGKVVVPNEAKVPFKSNVSITTEQFLQCVDFADKMAYGGNHQTLAFGSKTFDRQDGEIFKNALQGKLAEVGFYNYYTNKGKQMPLPDFGVWERGVWEDCDVDINGIKISIKSTKYFGNLLLLEKDRYSNEGLYLEPTKGKEYIKYDLTYLVRVKGVDSVNPNEYKRVEDVEIEITGYIRHKDFLHVIQSQQVIKKGCVLGIPMIVDNYYVCCADLHRV